MNNKKMKIVCIIPARGGSKRLKNKNILPLNGKALIAYSVERAITSKNIDATFVSTDNEEIAEIANKYGAETIFRSKEISGDNATSESALLHVLSELRDRGHNPEIIVFLQCTSPLRKTDDIDNAINKFIKEEADSLFSACRFDKYIWSVDKSKISPLNYDYNKRWREQDFPPQYLENGSIYVFKTSVLEKYNNRLGGKISFYEMSYLNSFQIDSLEDFTLIEYLLNKNSAYENRK